MPGMNPGHEPLAQRLRNMREAALNEDQPFDWPGIAEDCSTLSPAARDALVATWIPLRHLAWAVSLDAAARAAACPRSRPIKKHLENSARHLEICRFLSILGWALGQESSLQSARTMWLQAPEWQSMRRYAEDVMAISNPEERSLAFSLVLDGVLWPMLDTRALRRRLGAEAGPLTAQFETFFSRLCRASLALHPARAARRTFTSALRLEYWSSRAASAVLPVAEQAWSCDTDEMLGATMHQLGLSAMQAGRGGA